MPIPDKSIYGQNVEVRVYVDGTPKGGPEFATSVQIKQDATIHKRNYLNRKRQVTDKHIDGYTVSIKMDLTNTVLSDALRARDDLRDANGNVPDLTCSFKFTLRNGQEVMYMATDCEDVPDIDAGDRVQEVAFGLELTASDVQKVA